MKYCNDVFGHSYGDEFCVLMPIKSMKQVIQKYRKFEAMIENLNYQGFVILISVAIGYEIYDKRKDINILDTKERVDKNMY